MATRSQAKQAFDAMSKDPDIYSKMNDAGRSAAWEYGRDNGLISRDALNNTARVEYDKYVKASVPIYAPKITKTDVEAYGKYDKYLGYKGKTVPLDYKVDFKEDKPVQQAPKKTTQKVIPKATLQPSDLFKDLKSTAKQPAKKKSSLLEDIGSGIKSLVIDTPMNLSKEASKDIGGYVSDAKNFITAKDKDKGKALKNLLQNQSKRSMDISGTALGNLADTATLGIGTKVADLVTGGKASKALEEAKKNRPGLSSASGLLGYAGPFKVAGKVVAPVANKIVNSAGKAVVKGTLEGGLVGGLESSSRQAIAKGKVDPKEVGKNALMFGGIGAAGELVGAGLKNVKLPKKVSSDRPLNPIGPLPPGKKYTVKTAALDNATKAYEEAVKKVNNYYGTTNLAEGIKKVDSARPSNVITKMFDDNTITKTKTAKFLNNLENRTNLSTSDYEILDAFYPELVAKHKIPNPSEPVNIFRRVQQDTGVNIQGLVNKLDTAAPNLKNISKRQNLSYVAGAADKTAAAIQQPNIFRQRQALDRAAINPTSVTVQPNIFNRTLGMARSKIQPRTISEQPNIFTSQRATSEEPPSIQQAVTVVNNLDRKITPENRVSVINELIKNSDSWKDKSMPSLTRETWERNIIDIAGQKDGQKIVDAIFTPVHDNEAARVRFMNTERDKIKSLKLSQRESEVVQEVGEGLLPIDAIPERMDTVKIQNAVTTFREFYDRVLPMVNESLSKNGYKEVGALKNYFPHFEGDDPVLKALGINLDVANLPTDINGLSHQFRPGKNWAANLLHRTGDKTTYDAVAGFDKYIESVSKVIHHTDDIKNLRELNKALRSKYSTPEIQAEIDNIFKNPDLSQEAKDAAVEELLARSNTHLSNAASDLGEYTNVLAGKKDLADRAMERTFGRQAYNVANFAINRVAKNMVAINPASWVTNFIPITQAAATTGKKEVLQAMLDTIKSVGKSEFRDQSTFLTNRYGSDILTKGATDKVGDVLSKPMRWIDHFTSNVVTRSKYLENIKKGMPEDMAMKQAGEWASKIIGDRSLGSQPTLFNARNPLYKIATQFQLEVNNQLSFMFKDMPRSAFEGGNKAKAIAKLTAQYGQIAFYGYLYNELYKNLTGRRPAIDPIGFIKDTSNDVNNQNLSKNDVALNAIERSTGQLPFVGGLIGGGRLPVMNSMADVRGLIAGTADPKKELTKPIYYLIPPFGGGQIKKTAEGLSAVSKGGAYNKSGNLQYPIPDTSANKLKASLFGVSSLPETQDYYNNKRKPLSSQKTKDFKKSVDKGADPKELYNNILKDMMVNKIQSQMDEIRKDKKLSYTDRMDKLEPLKNKLDSLRQKK